MRFTKKAMRRKGFSLVEILVVLVIMAIITGGGMMIMGGSSDRAKYARAQQDLDVIQQAMVQYYNVRGSYDGVNKSAETLEGAIDTNGKKIFQSFVGKPIGEWKDPWENEYRIESTYGESGSGKGTIIAYCYEAGGGTASISGENLASGKVRKDATNNDKEMFRIVYNVNY